MHRIIKNIFIAVSVMCLLMLVLSGTSRAVDAEESSGNELVSCASGLLRIEAKDIRPEDLMKEIGEKCGIKVIVIGEAFAETPVSLKFKKMPVRRGIERALRVINVSNFLLHFDDTDNTTSRIVELDLIGKKGGEKHLTAGTPRTTTSIPGKPDPVKKESQENQNKRDEKKAVKTEIAKENPEKMQENFLKIMDEVMKTQAEGDEEPDPTEILKLFKEAVPQEMRDQIPPEVMEELEKLEAAGPAGKK
ncbi:MAG: hypothetical protein WCQ99_03250 [Pseudomonadota bacterium]